jgi:hypothetical protein
MIDAGYEPSGHMIRGRLAAETRLRLDLRELGLAPAAPKTGGQLLDDHLARLAAEGEEA